ncbi:hypothetical protein Lser_V15G17406 [Lactuca serriola]
MTSKEFVFDPIKWQRKQMNKDLLNLSKMFNAVKSLVRVPSVDPKYKIALLASKQDHCLVDLLHAWQDGKLPVQISSVISNHDRVGNTHVMRFLERHEIPYHYLSKSKEKNVEDEILGLVEDTDFLVLARYMQVLSGNFLKRYGKDVINIQHGLLPSFKGGNLSRQAFEAGVKLIGATTHFVMEELDGGPIIEQMVERVSHKDNLLSFIQKSDNLEKQCLMKAIKSYFLYTTVPRPSATFDMFPSWPMRVHQTPRKHWMLFKTLIGSFLLEMLLQSSMSFIHMMMSILHYFTGNLLNNNILLKQVSNQD